MHPTYENRERTCRLLEGDASVVAKQIGDRQVRLVLMDPPWNTGAVQKLGEFQYVDSFADFPGFLRPMLAQARRVLTNDGTCVVHMGVGEAHTTRVLLDEVFGRENFREELIAHHEVGRLPNDGWGCKHSHIYVYSKGRSRVFHVEHVPDATRNALQPGLGVIKRANSVLPATLVTTDGQRVGYPSQKLLSLYQTLVQVHSDPGDIVLDMFAGSGTAGDAALRAGRLAVLIDSNPAAVRIIARRLSLARVK